MDQLKRFLDNKYHFSVQHNMTSQYLRLRKHVDKPRADRPIRTTRDEVVCILCTDHLHSIHRVSMPSGRQWCLQHWQMLRPRVPE